ncbi:MAG: UTP--glucose-1-phosphate uridylyltransferase GalU [Gammaproteobacteria bacterium]|nr:UTP--glucose-1-phosphate uridylyltransferase GalU [Gammaproteobacteria bacterium]MDE2349229.1 UTP--glucose-1-phosphate uridylyltransferase GalU [Gammaproteobacteria bacterium]
MTKHTVKTVVFPVAGRGTRFLPATKASPKEMLPIVDKPLIQYAVDEALAAGADTLVFITGSSKRAIEDHFDTNSELEAVLQAQGKQELLDLLRGILPSWATCVYIRQPAPLGLGHAVLCARPVVGDAPFMVHLADDLIDADVPCLRQMVDAHRDHGGSILGVQNVPPGDTDKYGIVSLVPGASGRVGRMSHIVEKPRPDEAPSNLAVVGRYLLSGAIFDDLAHIGTGAGGEIQLTDGIARLMRREPVYAFEFEGKRYDCGSKLGYLQATVEYGLRHSSLGDDFAAYLKAFVATL